MEDTIEKNITVTAIENSVSGKLIVLKEGDDKYKIWKLKKDGTPTVAFTQFQKSPPGLGATVPIIYREEDKEYNGHPYKERTIVFFPTENVATSQNTPTSATLASIQEQTPEEFATQEELAALEKNTVVKLKLVANDHEKRLKVLEKFLTE